MHDLRGEFVVIGGLSHRTSRGHLILVEALARFDPDHAPIGRYLIAYRHYIDGNEASFLSPDPVRIEGEEFMVLQHGGGEPGSWTAVCGDAGRQRAAAGAARVTGYCLPSELWTALLVETERKVLAAQSLAHVTAEAAIALLPPHVEVSLQQLAVDDEGAWQLERRNGERQRRLAEIVDRFMRSGCIEARSIAARRDFIATISAAERSVSMSRLVDTLRFVHNAHTIR